MRKYGKWALTLGLMASTPGLGLAAAPWSRADADKQAEKPSAARSESGKTQNQKTADDVAAALGKARLQGFDIEIECKDGTAILKGRVVDPKQKDKATEVAQRVPGVKRVDNRLILTAKPSVSQRMTSIGVQQATHSTEGPQFDRVQPINHEMPDAAPAGNNQAMAEQVAGALTAASLDGYDIEIRYQGGTVVLGGSVGTNAQRQAAERVASQVPGVMSVQNQLRTTQEPLAPPRGPMGAGPMGPMGSMGAGPMMGPNGMPVHPAAFQGGMPPGAGAPMGPGGPAPMMAYGHGGPGSSQMAYNMPNMPEHAWPAYAQYPNSAGVTYPSQYSASAWPYIGPFYPYPQVPLGWRDATLRWDDGYWNLQFRQRTDKWWWFMNPHNW